MLKAVFIHCALQVAGVAFSKLQNADNVGESFLPAGCNHDHLESPCKSHLQSVKPVMQGLACSKAGSPSCLSHLSSRAFIGRCCCVDHASASTSTDCSQLLDRNGLCLAGYIIPRNVVHHFLHEYEQHGTFRGCCSVGFRWQDMENNSLKEHFKVPAACWPCRAVCLQQSAIWPETSCSATAIE